MDIRMVTGAYRETPTRLKMKIKFLTRGLVEAIYCRINIWTTVRTFSQGFSYAAPVFNPFPIHSYIRLFSLDSVTTGDRTASFGRFDHVYE